MRAPSTNLRWGRGDWPAGSGLGPSRLLSLLRYAGNWMQIYVDQFINARFTKCVFISCNPKMKWDNPAPQTILRVNILILRYMIKCNDYKSVGISLFTSTVIRNSLFFWVQMQQSYGIDSPSLEVHFYFMGLPGPSTHVAKWRPQLRGVLTPS